MALAVDGVINFAFYSESPTDAALSNLGNEILRLLLISVLFADRSPDSAKGHTHMAKQPKIVDLAKVIFDITEEHDVALKQFLLLDTMGWGTPDRIKRALGALQDMYPDLDYALHLHDTRGMGLANALAAWQVGVIRFDAALGGLGGCPYAPGASGNICTEDLVHMFECMGIATGCDLDGLIAASATLPALIGHDTPGQVVKAGKADRRYPLPEHAR